MDATATPVVRLAREAFYGKNGSTVLSELSVHRLEGDALRRLGREVGRHHADG